MLVPSLFTSLGSFFQARAWVQRLPYLTLAARPNDGLPGFFYIPTRPSPRPDLAPDPTCRIYPDPT